MSESIENAHELDIYDVNAMENAPRADVERLIEQTPLLANDTYTQRVLENDFIVTVNNEEKELKPGVFACLRLAFLEQMRSTNTLENGRRHAAELEAAMVVHSTDRIVDGDNSVADTQ